MMKAVGFETGLIRFASENNVSKKQPTRFTARMRAYSVVMVVLLGVLVYLLASRADVGVSILRTPGQLYQELPGGMLSNLYNYKLLNKTYVDKQLEFRPENFHGEISFVGKNKLDVPKEEYLSGSMFIKMSQANIKGRKTKLKIGVYENGERIATIKTSFLGPFSGI
jgi:hypothetical protein